MRTIETTIVNCTDGIEGLEGLNIQLSDVAIMNLEASGRIIMNNHFVNAIDVNLTTPGLMPDSVDKLIPIIHEDEVVPEFRVFMVSLDKTGTFFIKAWLKNNHEEYVDAEFNL